jgi:hypothetical protein
VPGSEKRFSKAIRWPKSTREEDFVIKRVWHQARKGKSKHRKGGKLIDLGGPLDIGPLNKSEAKEPHLQGRGHLRSENRIIIPGVVEREMLQAAAEDCSRDIKRIMHDRSTSDAGQPETGKDTRGSERKQVEKERKEGKEGEKEGRGKKENSGEELTSFFVGC